MATDELSGLLFLLGAPFALLLAVIGGAYAAGFHSDLLQPKLWLRALAAAALATLFSVGLYGYSFRTSDYQASQLPLIQRLADPEAYPRDAYVDTAGEFPSGLARLVAAGVRRGLPLERLARDFHLAALFLTFLAFFFLCRALFQDVRGAWLSTALFAVSHPLRIASPLALEVAGKDHFDATEGVWPFVVCAMTFWALGRTALASAAAGAVCYLHPLLGILLLAVIVATAAAECVLNRRHSPVLALTTALLPGAAVSLPFWMTHAGPGLLEGGAALAQALRAWYPLAFFGGSWTLPHWATAAGVLLLAGQAVWRARSYEEYRDRFPAFLLALPFLWLVGFVFSDLVPFRPVLLAQLFRTDSFLVLLGLAAAGHMIGKYLGSARAQTWCVGGLLVQALAGPPSPMYLLLVSAVWALWEWANEREFESYGPWLWGGCVAIAGLLAAWSLASLLGAAGAWGLGPDRSLGTLLLVALAGLGSWRQALLPAWARRAAAAAALLLAFLPSFRIVAWRVQHRTLAYESERDRDASDLAAALSEMSGPQERFLVPPSEKFRLLLGRPVVFEWLDGVAMQWAPGFDQLFLARLEDFRIDPAAMAPFWAFQDRAAVGARGAGGPSPVEDAFRALKARDLAALAEKHQAAFIVTYGDQSIGGRYFTEVAANRRFRAYQYLYNYK